MVTTIRLALRQAVIALALPPLTAWFDQHLRPGKLPSALAEQFSEWTARQQASDRVQFEVKDTDAGKSPSESSRMVRMPVAGELADLLLSRERAAHTTT